MRRGALLVGASILLAGCGGALPSQDANEPEGEFPIEVVRATFPEEQALAKESRLAIEVRNAGDRTIPDINVTVEGFQVKLRDPNDPSRTDRDVADPSRPIFVVEKSPIEFLRDRSPLNQSLVDREVNPPYGKHTAYVNTYSLGELEPGDTALFRWDVSAVVAGPFEVAYEVNAGLDGNAVAVAAGGGGESPTGTFAGRIDSTPPRARVTDDGTTIVTSDGRRIEGRRGAVSGRD